MNELFENEIRTRVNQELQRFLSNPMNIIQVCQETIQKQALQIEEMKPKVEFYEQFLDSNGEMSCTIAADAVNLNYINPKGKSERMGNMYFLQVLTIDHIIHKEPNGYNIYASHKHYGRTKITTRNNHIKTSVLFNAKGLDYLIKKYKDDKRIWQAINGQLYCGEDA